MAEQVFYLRGRHAASRLLNVGLLVYAALGIAFIPVVVLLTILAAATDWKMAVFVTLALLFPFVGFLCWKGLRRRVQNAHVLLTDESLTVRGDWPDIRIPLGSIASISQSTISVGDRFRAAGLSPWNGTLFGLRYPSARTLRLTLQPGVAHPWWPIIRYKTVLIDPEDWPPFIEAIRRVAARVAVDVSLVQ